MRNCKEYLVKNLHGEYAVTDGNSGFELSELIEIPEGADFYVRSKMYKDNFFFCMDNSGIIETFDTILKNSWHRESTFETINLSDNYDIVWQRYQDEPFLTPETALNDQCAEIEQVRQHKHYFKDVSSLNEIDVYMVLKMFNVTDPCLQHIAKKALCAGQRGHKDFKKDLQDILDTAKRAVEINNG